MACLPALEFATSGVDTTRTPSSTCIVYSWAAAERGGQWLRFFLRWMTSGDETWLKNMQTRGTNTPFLQESPRRCLASTTQFSRAMSLCISSSSEQKQRENVQQRAINVCKNNVLTMFDLDNYLKTTSTEGVSQTHQTRRK